MKTLTKSWTPETKPIKKLLSRMLTYRIASMIDREHFEVLYETPLNAKEKNLVPDIVVFDKHETFSPVIAIECCAAADVFEISIFGRHLMNEFSLKEFFIFEYENFIWHRLDKDGEDYGNYSFSNILGEYLSVFSKELV